MKTNTLSSELPHKMDSYWRAANYLSAGQILLYDNQLLKRIADTCRCEEDSALSLGHDARAVFYLCAKV
jgi:phosphoketolase